jgi:cytoplasmic iron level regulating protein YaaA (DUF328/UPF0246 family)
MPQTIYLVSCVKQKALMACPAESLYQSDWFRKAKGWVLRHLTSGDRWFILSAKYHLVAPTHVIPPYEQTLLRMPKNLRQAWAGKVLSQLKEILHPGDRIVILAGDCYREFLEPGLSGYPVEVPMKGLSIGRQLAWLSYRPRSQSLF